MLLGQVVLQSLFKLELLVACRALVLLLLRMRHEMVADVAGPVKLFVAVVYEALVLKPVFTRFWTHYFVGLEPISIDVLESVGIGVLYFVHVNVGQVEVKIIQIV